MLGLSLEAPGMEAVKKQLKYLARVSGGKAYKSAELIAKKRKEGDETSAQILEYLADQGRDFTDLSDSEIDKVAQAWLDMIFDRFRIISKQTSEQKAALAASNKGLTEAMLKLMGAVTQHIDEGKFSGGGNPKLSESYEKYKRKRTKGGFAYPIGVFSGQLKDALNPHGPASRNIRIRRK